jgi:zinc transport system permease protein
MINIENLTLISSLTLLICSINCSLIGNFVLWKKLSFYGDTLSHSAIFGLALGYFFNINQILILIIFNLIFSILINFLSRQKIFAIDSIVMILSYLFISFGILFNNKFNPNIEFEEFILGNISSITIYHLLICVSLFLLIILFILFFTKDFLLTIINQDIAITKKIKENKINLFLMIIISLLIAFAVKITGILMVTALMIIPCATSRMVTKNPFQMIKFSAIISALIALFGIYFSHNFNIDTIPTIIFINTILFFTILILKRIFYEEI